MFNLKDKLPHKANTQQTKGIRKIFIDFNTIQVKSEPTEQIENDSVNDPLLIDYSSFNVKEETTHNKREFYGRIALEIDDNGAHIYHFICDKCTKSFSNLENFDEHIRNKYLSTSKDHPNGENNVVLEADEIKLEIIENQTQDKHQSTNTSNGNKDANESDCNILLDFSGSESDDTSYEPAAKKHKLSRGRSLTLSLDYPDKECVSFFLKLLKTHAILWLKRHSIIKPFTTASTTFINEFKAKYPTFNLTKTNLQKAIDRIKATYERANSKGSGDEDSNEKMGAFKTKNTEFLKLCAEIDEHSRQIENNCDLCKAVFYCAKELQTHKFKIHKVGELPFKCKRCGYGFASPEKLAGHEEKHNRVKSYKCETCDYECYLESKLLAHQANMHSDDRKIICEVCGFICADPVRYNHHKRKHEPRKEKCSTCGKSFKEKWQLVDHKKAHQNLRSYLCNLCGKGFNRQKNLYIHKRCVHKIKNKYEWHENLAADTKNSDDDDTQNICSSTTQATNHSQDINQPAVYEQTLPLDMFKTIFQC